MGKMEICLCVGICAIVTIIAATVVFKMKKRLEEKRLLLENDRKQYDLDKEELKKQQDELKKNQTDLYNAQILFKKEQEAKADFTYKTEKEICIDLFVKFLNMESAFMFMQNSLISIDSKLNGVKNYSEDLENMKNEVSKGQREYTQQLKIFQEMYTGEMKSIQQSYARELLNIYGELKETLTGIDEVIKETVTKITNREMNNMTIAVNWSMTSMEKQVQTDLESMSSQITEKLAMLSENVESTIISNMPESISKEDVKDAVKVALDDQSLRSAFMEELDKMLSEKSEDNKSSVNESANENNEETELKSAS